MKLFFIAASLAAMPRAGAAAPSALAKASCPAAVTDAVGKAHAGARVLSCKEEKQDGKVQYEVKLKSSDGKRLEVDVAPEGAILLTEEKVAVSAVPPAVLKAFAARYPKAKASAAEKQSKPDGKVTYELAFKAGGKRKEATFGEDGSFAGEE